MILEELKIDGDVVSGASFLEVVEEFLERVPSRENDVTLVMTGEDDSEVRIRYDAKNNQFGIKSALRSADFPDARAGLQAFCKTDSIAWILFSFVKGKNRKNAMLRVKVSENKALELWLRKADRGPGIEFFVREPVARPIVS